MDERCPIDGTELSKIHDSDGYWREEYSCDGCPITWNDKLLALARATRDREIAAAVAEAVKPWRETLIDALSALKDTGEAEAVLAQTVKVIQDGNRRRTKAIVSVNVLLTAAKPPCDEVQP
jgi:hypothetical protein